jgi:hypothetical protein
MFPVLSANSASGYFLTKSLRFRASASAYLNRTPASAGNRKTWTWSAWVKRGDMTSNRPLISAYSDASNRDVFQFDTATLQYVNISGGSANTNLNTTQVFRDPSAWYHIVLAVDTTQATASNRIKMYVNGLQITAFGTATYPSQNTDMMTNNNVGNYIGREVNGSQYFDGYMTEVNFIDGQQLTPSSFGTTNALTGVWQPAKYTGTYGTNGYYLPFTNTTSTSTLGNDFSGNSNTWTVNNISLTAGATYDSMNDVPTLTSATASNYCVLNPILQNGWWAAPNRGNIINGNLTLSQNNGSAFSTFDVSTTGKWYCEGTVTTYGQSGANSEFIVAAQSRTTFEVSYLANGSKQINASTTGYGSSWTTGDVIGIAIDPANNQVTYYKNGTSQGALTNTFPANTTILVGYYAESTGTDVINFNFGQRPFVYTPPSGFVALNTYNLPTSTIVKGNTVMDATLFTSTGTTQTVTNAGGFKPDFIWTKVRNTTFNHYLVDTNRGLQYNLNSDLTIAEVSYPQFVTSANSNGFTLGTSNYANGNSVVGWQWQAGQGSTSSNTSGSITSTVSVNATAGFSIATYAGTGANATVGHGLGVAPQFVIVKNRTVTDDWCVYTLPTGAANYAQLNLTGAFGANSTIWNNTTPTSSVFSVGTYLSKSGSNYVAYCWTPIAGFSAFGSYTGNGSTDGPFIYCGFRPKFILYKNSSATGSWAMLDTSRGPYNVVNPYLLAESSTSEDTSVPLIDILSNGFKMRNTYSSGNANGNAYIYAAFAENPFKNALAR